MQVYTTSGSPTNFTLTFQPPAQPAPKNAARRAALRLSKALARYAAGGGGTNGI